MKKQWTVVGIIVGLLILLIGAGWLVRDRFLPVEVGTVAPTFTATDLSGNPVTLETLRGEVVLLNIWATWCGPCRQEMPSMQRLHEQFGDQLRIVAVSVDAPFGRVDPGGNLGGNVEAFAREMGLTFDIWMDPTGEIQRLYRTTGVPETFIIGRDGVIVRKQIGEAEWDSPAHIELIQRLLES
jgi:cytochrome c biogenesis protein CcmG, thiol:disulfide interchange protein DsbE